MQFNTITPEQAGISSRFVETFLRKLQQRGLYVHDVLLMRGNDLFCEVYWKPFHKDYIHRQYSQTKSFVAIAIGLLAQEGKLGLDDPMYTYFPDMIHRELPENLKRLTIRQMLTMQTAGGPPNWFTEDDPSRTHLYLAKATGSVVPGLRWSYDSAGSQVLCALTERVAGMPLLELLRSRIFCHLDAFHSARILKCRDEESWGDSALLCTPRDMAAFARFVMNYGKWNGKQIMDEAFLREATSPLVSNDRVGFDCFETQGYGYQIWAIGEDGFFFNGAAGQLTFCYPKKDLIFVINGDNDGYAGYKKLIYAAFEDFILDNLQDAPLPEDPDALESLRRYSQTLELQTLAGHRPELLAGFRQRIEGKTWICQKRKPGITQFSLHFTDDTNGELRYTNAQGDKILPFGLGHNVFARFPQEGYPTEHGGVPNTDGYLYKCAVSGALREENKLFLKVQLLDVDFGNALFTLSFRGSDGILFMVNDCEGILEEYTGLVPAKEESVC